jgi:hypothetical protein
LDIFVQNNTKGEHYKSTNGNSSEIISAVIWSQFTALGAQSKGIGSPICQTLINSYKEATKSRFT